MTGQKVQRAIWTTLQPPTTTTAAQLPAPRRASAWRHASAFWTCAGPALTTPKTQRTVPRRPGKLWCWSKESKDKKRMCWRDFDSFTQTLINWAVYKLPATNALHLETPQSNRDFECHSWCIKKSYTSWQCCYSHFLYEGHCTSGLLREKEHGYVDNVSVKGDGWKKMVRNYCGYFSLFPFKAEKPLPQMQN